MVIGQQDRTIHEQLPPREQWPEIRLPDHLTGRFALNCVNSLLTRHIEAGRGNLIALREGNTSIDYASLFDQVGRMATFLRERCGLRSGARVLLRGPNSIDMAVSWLAVQQCGAIAVTTLSMLRQQELATILNMATPDLCICASDLADDLERAADAAHSTSSILLLGGDAGEKNRRNIAAAAPTTTAYPTYSDDIALIGFTSGTTGKPKATVHFHRDVIAVCEIIAGKVLNLDASDTVIGTAPLAFTFGLGGLLLFPLYAGATTVLHGRYQPEQLLEAIGAYHATICFTVPAFYQRMARLAPRRHTGSLRLAVCSGEALPRRVSESWAASTAIALTEFLGSTEMLHAFVGSTGDQVREGKIGRAFPGYRVAILDGEGNQLPAGKIGRFAVQGPTGCRYLADDRQRDYVQGGWNITGDSCSMDEDGYVIFHARSDDMIISSGYNISGVEVEDVLLTHPAVGECAVIGEDDEERGAIVVAYVVLKDHRDSHSSDLVPALQSFVSGRLAPYKYPRAVRFVDRLPRNESGKIQRFRLRDSVGSANPEAGH